MRDPGKAARAERKRYRLYDPDGLTPQQRECALEFLITRNTTKAAQNVGKSGANAAAYGRRTMEVPEVRDFVNREIERINREKQVTAEGIVERLRQLAFGDIRRLYHADGRLKRPDELDEEEAAILASVDIDTVTVRDKETGDVTVSTATAKVRRWDPIKALDALAKYRRLYGEGSAPPPPPPPAPTITTTDPIEAARLYQRLIEGKA